MLVVLSEMLAVVEILGVVEAVDGDALEVRKLIDVALQ